MNFDIKGRVLINIWRVARSELRLTSYDLENVVFNMFSKREPHFSNTVLS